MQNWENKIFGIKSEKEFCELALHAFRFQYENVLVYRNYCEALSVHPERVQTIFEIPFLPIEFFKQFEILANDLSSEIVFNSSGTGSQKLSSHHVHSLALYEKSFLSAFQLFYGDPSQYCFLALLPSYLERGGSSLVYMCKELIQMSQNSLSDFYLYDFDKLSKTIETLSKTGQPTVLIGVTYALLDFADSGIPLSENFIVMETGGMKGKRKEMIKQEVHQVLRQKFKIREIHSEYGMTELLSQAYSKKEGLFQSPPWMRILIRDAEDPFSYHEVNRSGGINVIDLANIYSCCFIETKDLGKLHPKSSFEVLGRFDNSDLRGCNLMMQF